MKNVVITIARQYGSGGRTVGEMLAEKMGIHFSSARQIGSYRFILTIYSVVPSSYCFSSVITKPCL